MKIRIVLGITLVSVAATLTPDVAGATPASCESRTLEIYPQFHVGDGWCQFTFEANPVHLKVTGAGVGVAASAFNFFPSNPYYCVGVRNGSQEAGNYCAHANVAASEDTTITVPFNQGDELTCYGHAWFTPFTRWAAVAGQFSCSNG